MAARYDRLLGGLGGMTLPFADRDGDVRSWFVYVIRLDPAIDRNAVMAALGKRGVQSKPYLPAIHLQPFYRSRGHREGELPVAEAIARSLAIPFFAAIAPEDQERVVDALARAVEHAAA